MQRRVTAYTAAGIQCCLPGLGDDLTFPSTWSVRSALNGSLWVRFATEDEKKASGKWWHLLEFEPKAILHSNGTHAFDWGTTRGLWRSRDCIGATQSVSVARFVPA